MSWFTERLATKSKEIERFEELYIAAYMEYYDQSLRLECQLRRVWLSYMAQLNQLYEQQKQVEQQIGRHLEIDYELVHKEAKARLNEGSGSPERRQTEAV